MPVFAPYPPAGTILAYGAATAPAGYLNCDGSAVSRTVYAGLFGIIGTTYGSGDGSTTFNVPDLRGRSPLGSGTGTAAGATAQTLGSTPTTGSGGEQTHTQTVNEMPSHTHGPNGGTNRVLTPDVNNGTAAPSGSAVWGALVNSNTGGGAAFNILHPITVVNFIIKT